MHCNQNFMNLLTICRKAGKVIPGFDSVKECLEQHTAKVVLISADLSPITAKEVAFFCQRYQVPLQETDLTMDQIRQAIGRKTGVLAICDAGFARGLCSRMEPEHPIL